MFNDRYGLTQAVIELRKTMTRRVCKEFRTGEIIFAKDVESIGMYSNENLVEFSMKDGSIKVSVPKYKVGDVVAVAQSYKSIHEDMMNGDYGNSMYDAFRCAMVAGTKGWDNKMYVKADLMPHQILITDMKIERLQDISEEDCFKEGIIRRDDMINSRMEDVVRYTFENSFVGGVYKTYATPREAFAALIDKASGKGTCESYPYVFAYSFKLIK